MPIECQSQIARLSTEEFRELDYRVMKHAVDSQNSLGRLADERIYQAGLSHRLSTAGMSVSREVQVRLSHNEFTKSLFLDLVVAEQAVYELKTVKAITDEHIGQLLILDLPRGKLVNFRPAAVESQYVNAPLTSSDRKDFTVDDSSYRGRFEFRNLVIGLIRDWGTVLTLSLYQEAIVALLGGQESVEAMVPLQRDGVPLGNQRYQLVSPNSAFSLTAMNRDTSDYRKQLARLISFSPLHTIHWINIAHHKVTLTTITNN